MEVLGLTSSIPAITWAQIHTRPLQNYILTQWDGEPSFLETSIPVLPLVKQSLQWWFNPLRYTSGADELKPTLSGSPDTSTLGWGDAHGDLCTLGKMEL